MRPSVSVPLLLAFAAVAHAQTRATPAPEPPANSFGTVVGHISVSGSNGPARFAKVALQPVEVKAEAKTESNDAAPSPKTQGTVYRIYQTGLDGSYAIPHVTPGKYYLVVTAPGYLSPFDRFTHAELEHPSAEVQQRIDTLLTTVTVRANATATQDLQLQRGAEIGGAVRFDDGTPFPEASIGLERRDADGKWVSPLNSSYTSSDHDGRYEFTGLTPGEYRVGVYLFIQELKQSSLIGDRGMMVGRSSYSLTVYSGDTTRKTDAKTRSLTDGEAANGFDITIPVSKMHTLSGTLVDARTGQVVNAGKVSLLSGDDEIASSTIDSDGGAFAFSFVPEGTYKLEIKDAREVRREVSASEPYFGFDSAPKETVVQKYGPGELPVTLVGDMLGVNLPVQAASAKVH